MGLIKLHPLSLICSYIMFLIIRITDNGASTNVGARLSRIDGNTYKKIIKYTMSHPKYVLPVQLALHAAAVHDKRIHSQADTVLNDIGYLAESKFYFVLKRFPAMPFNLKFMGKGGTEA